MNKHPVVAKLGHYPYHSLIIQKKMTKRSLHGLSIALVLVAFPSSGQDPNNHNLLFIGDFETGDFRQLSDARWQHTMKKSKVVENPVRRGQYAASLELDHFKHKKNVNYRTDLAPKDYLRQNIGSEYWYGFSSLFPKDWKPDTQSELFAQFHASADTGEKARPPILALYIYGSQYTIKKRWDTNENSNRSDLNGANSTKLWKENVAPDAGKWVDWVFHVKWSFGKDGFIEVWKNREKIVSDLGYNDRRGPYFRFGPYKWPWKKSERQAPSTVTRLVNYFDDIRIGNSSASYDLVSPPEPAASVSFSKKKASFFPDGSLVTTE